jgi:hypothetical protein
MRHVWGGGAYRVLVRKPEGKRPIARPRYKWKDNIKKWICKKKSGGHGLD